MICKTMFIVISTVKPLSTLNPDTIQGSRGVGQPSDSITFAGQEKHLYELFVIKTLYMATHYIVHSDTPY